MLASFISKPDRYGAEDLRPFLPEVRAIGFYYRFMLDYGDLTEAQRSMVRQYIAQLYAAQVLMSRYAGN